jgi:proteasome lid subunit RPN8/RPN11
MRAHNADPGPTRYLIDPVDHFAAMKRARAEALEVIGGYHSHPHSAAVPSPTDLAGAWAGFLYVIVGMPAGERVEVRAYELDSGNFQEVHLVPVS